MIYTALTNRAMQIAYEAHAGQVDKCGTPYVFHPYHLAEQMPDEVTTCVALLHDVVEDTEVTVGDLSAEFPPEVTEPLRLLTRDPAVPYLDYISKLAENPVALVVKLADLTHNMDETRYAGAAQPDPADLARRREKYAAAKRALSLAKIRGIIAERAGTDDECYEDVDRCWAELGAALTEDYETTEKFLLEDCTADEFAWVSEVYEEIFENAREMRYANLLRRAAKRFLGKRRRFVSRRFSIGSSPCTSTRTLGKRLFAPNRASRHPLRPGPALQETSGCSLCYMAIFAVGSVLNIAVAAAIFPGSCKSLVFLHNDGCVILRLVEHVVHVNDALGVQVKRDITLHLKRAVAVRAQVRVGAKGL